MKSFEKLALREEEVGFDQLPSKMQKSVYLKEKLAFADQYKEAFHNTSIISQLMKSVKDAKEEMVHFHKEDITQVFRQEKILKKNANFPFGVEYNIKTRIAYFVLREEKAQLIVESGSFCSLKILKNNSTDRCITRKTQIIFPSKISVAELEEILASFESEFNILKKVYGKNNVACAIRRRKQSWYNWFFKKEAIKLDIFMPWFDGQDLIDYCSTIQTGKESELLCCKIILEVALELQKIHKLGILHRDIKPENIKIKFVDGKIKVQILDFNLSLEATRTIKEDAHDIIIADAPYVSGSPRYVDLRIKVKNKKHELSSKHDAYSLIVVLFEMLKKANAFSKVYGLDHIRLKDIMKYFIEKGGQAYPENTLCLFMLGERNPSLQSFITWLQTKILTLTKTIHHEEKKAEIPKLLEEKTSRIKINLGLFGVAEQKEVKISHDSLDEVTIHISESLISNIKEDHFVADKTPIQLLGVFAKGEAKEIKSDGLVQSSFQLPTSAESVLTSSSEKSP
jgi:serine/threonine protein kinase